MRKEKSFTIIELLVVIAIIGLLSSIVLVATKGTKEKARIAKLLNFSSQIYHAIGAEVVGEWRFEDTLQGDTVTDTSGYGNHGEWKDVSGDQWMPNDDIPQLGTAGQFDGSNYVKISDSSSLRFKRITVEIWLKPDDLGDKKILILHKSKIFYLYSNPSNPVSVQLDISCLPHVCTCYAYTDSATSFIRNDGKWHHIVVTYDGSKVKIFIDAKEFSYAEQDCGATGGDMIDDIYEQPIFLGQGGSIDAVGYLHFVGLLDEVRIYNAPLSLGQIKKHYAEGARKRGLLADK